VTRGLALVLSVAVVGVVGGRPGTAADTAAAPTAKLKTISERQGRGGPSLVIEASEPVPYMTTRPDPLTVLLDFRNVGAENVANAVGGKRSGLIAGVKVERVESMGVPMARVRIALGEPIAHIVRSDRNTVLVEFDRSARGAVPSVMPPAPATGLPDAMQALARAQAPAAAPNADPIATLLAPTPAPAAARPVLLAQGPAAPAPAPAAAPTAAVMTQQQQPSATPAVEQGQARIVRQTGREYNGHPITLDFQQADLRLVLRAFNEISGLNIVIDPTVQGSVDVALRDVPWDQALDIILRANKLGYILDGTIVRIAPLTVLADEEGQRRKLADEQALAGQLHVLTKTLSYARAEDLQTLLTRSALSQRGTVQIDPRTNTLIISDLSDRLQTASQLIETLDKAQPQVEIEARIVQTNRNFARELGVQWGFSGRADAALGNTTNLAFPNNGNLSGRVGPLQGPAGAATTPTAVNLPVGSATSGVGISLGSVNGAFNLDMALTALEQSGNGRILSTPRVSTLNNVEAQVMQGVQIPLQTIANNTVTVTFKDAALLLTVTPQITAADTVIMRIQLENATPDFSRAAGPAAIPPIDTQRAITTLLVNDGQTTVIGGIYTSNQQNLTNKTPGLGEIPLLKWLFRRDRVSDESRELLIFITPRIIRG
jgi:type IV pilus secretin PilQ/predicted competence protein